MWLFPILSSRILTTYGSNLNVHGQRKWIKKRWYIYTEEYCSAVKNEIMLFVATWKDLETAILSEVSQRQKKKYCMTSLICGI